MFRIKYFLFVLILFNGGLLPAQTGAQRPKLGLALSGGGAKGLAHIGVLKVLEELGLYPDYITGTSMGSIVGGLYAVGYTPDSLERFAVNANWPLILSDDIPLDQVNFEEKPYFNNELVELSFRDGALKEPGGLIQGQQIEELLQRLTLPEYDCTDFDSLPVPYRCVAADIVTGKVVVFREGDLAEAMRASMAIPSVFSPVQKDTMVLVDGGLIRNFPVQELKEMGADVVIGVYVGFKAEEEENLRSIQKILKQIAFMQSVEDYRRQLPLVDLYIEPDPGKYTGMNFQSASSIIALGEQAARAHYGSLRQLADSLNAFGRKERPQLNALQSIQLDRIEITGNNNIEVKEITGRAGLEPGQRVTSDDLSRAVENLAGTNRYEKVGYDLSRQGEENVLQIDVFEKSPHLLKASLLYDSYHEAGVIFNLIFRNLALRSSRLMIVGQLSDNFRFRIEHLKYIDKRQHWFVNTSLQFNRDAIPSLEEGRIIEQFRVHDFPFELTLNHRPKTNLVYRIGGQLEFLTLEPVISSDPGFKELAYTNLNLLGGVGINTLDRNVLPRKGALFDLEIKYATNLQVRLKDPIPEFSGGDSLFRFAPFPKITLQLQAYLPLGRKWVLVLQPFAGALGTSDVPVSDFYLMGAPEATSRRAIPFYGLDPNEFIAQVTLGMNLGLQYFLQEKLMFGASFSGAGVGVPNFQESEFPVPDEFISGAGLTFGYDSIVGPVKITVMYPFSNESGIRTKLKTFLSFGHRF